MHIESTSKTSPFCSFLLGQKHGIKDKFSTNNNINSQANEIVKPAANNDETFICKCYKSISENNAAENSLHVRSSIGIDYLIADFRKSISNTLNNPSNGIQVKNRLLDLDTVPKSDLRQTDSARYIPRENTIRKCDSKKDIYRISNGVEESKYINFHNSQETQQQVF